MIRAAVASLVLSIPPAAGLADPVLADRQKLDGPQIVSALEGRTVSGVHNGQAWDQDFRKGGITVYRAAGDAPSEGRWRVKSDRFCSQWPPSRAWVCYDIFLEGSLVSFVPSDGGDVWRGNIGN